MPTEQIQEMMDALWAEVIAGSDVHPDAPPSEAEIIAMYNYMVNQEL